MTAPLPSRVAFHPLPRGKGRGEGAPPAARAGFTLVELLVTISIVIVLIGLLGSVMVAARNGAQAGTTSSTIARLDQIVSTQFRRYEAASVPRSQLPAGIANPSAARAWHIRRNMISADMPDRWSDVAYMAGSGTAGGFLSTPAQAAIVAIYNAAATKPSAQFGGAECLFAIVMQGGFADCLDCKGLAGIRKGDKDNDGALEFWDEWGNPIDYILWAPGFQNTRDSTAFFSKLDAAFPGSGSVRPGLGMRPLIYSAGPDGKYGLSRDPAAATADQNATNTANLDRGSSPVGRDCGNPADAGTATMGAPTAGSGDADRGDNIVNVELGGSG